MTAVSAAAITPVLLGDGGEDASACAPEVSEFRHHGRSSQVYTFTCTDEPQGVLIHLHGDGADEFDLGEGESSTLHELSRVAGSHNLVLVAPRTPDNRRGSTWWRKLDRNTAWLTALVTDRVQGDPALDPGNVWWSGYSGGAEMLSYGILRRAQDLVTGGAVLMAGGGAPDTPPGPTFSPLTVPLRWYVGDLDDGTRSYDNFDALTAAHEGSAWYRDHGATDADLEILPGIAHLDFPQAEVLGRVLDGSPSR